MDERERRYKAAQLRQITRIYRLFWAVFETQGLITTQPPAGPWLGYLPNNNKTPLSEGKLLV
jgi:hypothetical protein